MFNELSILKNSLNIMLNRFAPIYGAL